MNMLDDEDDQSFHATRDGYSHLSDVEWDAVERMGSTMDIHAVSVMLEALNRDAQHATIAKFIQNELDAEREKVALLHQQGSQQAELLREQGAQQFELLRQQQAAAGGSMHSRRPETLKIDISKYRGVEEDSLLRWFVELDDAIRARRIDEGICKLHSPSQIWQDVPRLGHWGSSCTTHMRLGRWKSSSRGSDKRLNRLELSSGLEPNS
uniref:Uncharacterized protein n=1 Tax=Peronospora matthiolae TaxID=2874970 RepID=A0AAV1VC85_9STRA